jgi:hypothetical protein
VKKITEDSVKAFFKGSKLTKGNMSINTDMYFETDRVMRLHGNAIAWIKGSYLTISDCGWQTVTTKERLNGILTHLNLGYIFQKDFVWYYSAGNGCVKPFNGSMEVKL